MHRTTAEEQLNSYFGLSTQNFEAERLLINELSQELRNNQIDVSNKNLILALVRLLETEEDVVKLDIYRNALEHIVQKTPDDL
ncbi:MULTISPECIES: biofilm development regulator YmgB/AriR family protein [unclassified Enterobacter]|uniref:biofilm development regulator YmgB/AriR family protein n=1 Tax=unclassified Enterobacter TaxID=2608935 RepID=UPI0008E40646|nr:MULTISPECIES: biofilm development regulator YmgB/AriR family protein [unclassified Enterobacter]SFR06007.1 Biofilm development protein YmgB/AriR [Enterobacter sp. kpr-6]